MSWLRLLAAVGVLTAEATAVMAADMPETLPPPVVVPPPRFFDFNYGWYVRGDLGYGWGAISSAQSPRSATDPTDNKFGNGFLGGLGVGIKSRWLRTDVTVDYMAPLKYEGTVAAPNDTSAKVTAVTALFNGYLDLGTWYHITPYIGGGVGAAQIRTSDYVGVPAFASDLSRTQWKFAWAVMAGAGYAVAPNIVIDLGYRYLNFGDVTTASDSFGVMTMKNLAAHEVRVGVRWSFDDLPLGH